MILYHASRVDTLHKTGIRAGVTANAAREPMPHIYYGTLDYIREQYFSYCKPGMYIIYRVDLTGIPLDDSLAGEQWRSRNKIDASRVTVFTTEEVAAREPTAAERAWAMDADAPS